MFFELKQTQIIKLIKKESEVVKPGSNQKVKRRSDESVGGVIVVDDDIKREEKWWR